MTDVNVYLKGRVGARTLGDGNEDSARLDQHGAMAANLGGDYAEAARRGMIFSASNVAAQAVSVALSTTYTGLLVYNPTGSGKRMILIAAKYALSVAPAAIASLHLLRVPSGTYTHTTPLAAPGIVSTKIGGSTASAMGADSAATIPTPTYLMSAGSGFTAGALYADSQTWLPINGAITVEPGCGIAWGALTAVTGFGSFMWIEETIRE